jgi:thioredoxin 1
MDVNEQNWDAEVMQASGLVLVDFYATWCPPCNALKPILTVLENKNQDKLKIVKMNTDENSITATKYNVAALPTLVFFKNGEVLQTLVGLQNEAKLQQVIDSFASV